jgi:hypothetical protein
LVDICRSIVHCLPRGRQLKLELHALHRHALPANEAHPSIIEAQAKRLARAPHNDSCIRAADPGIRELTPS